jgi:hypothetical protein
MIDLPSASSACARAINSMTWKGAIWAIRVARFIAFSKKTGRRARSRAAGLRFGVVPPPTLDWLIPRPLLQEKG